MLRATELLFAPTPVPQGRPSEADLWPQAGVSDFLGKEILGKFREHPLWRVCHPVLLGSWGRGELTPKSDLDLLFLGNSDQVLSLVTDLQNEGFRIRYRIPENPEDWSQGVEVSDWLSLWKAKAETEEGRVALEVQQKAILGNSRIKRKIVAELMKERKTRARRFDSIESFLEPQLKFGPGGLRDLFQGLVILDLFPEKFQAAGYERKILEYYRLFFLTVRQKLHFDGFSDVLVASEQFEISRWLGFEDNSQFMRQIHRGLARVHFYSEWILHSARESRSGRGKRSLLKFRQPEDLLQALVKEPSILTQYQVRLNLDRFAYSKTARSRMLKALFSGKASDETLQAVFRSRLIDKLVPQIKNLVGLVQHDQYHRFTADAHLLQACREVFKIQHSPRLLGPLKVIARDLKRTDWEILAWSALYHDLAKGLSGDHSQIGETWVRKDLKDFGFGAEFRNEVAWLVRHHLELSMAAFRKNPQSPKTWQDLQDLGLNEKRLQRLAIWTALDIRATNPEAWTEWKAKLLNDLVQKILSGGTQNFLSLKKKLPKGLSSEALDQLDPLLFENFTLTKLKADLEKALAGGGAWTATSDSRRKQWIRYQDPVDRSGLLSELVEKIYSSGASIQHALIQTVPGLGVYDWFQVQTPKDSQTLVKLLSQMKVTGAHPPAVQFLKIEIVSQSETEWVLSFRGVDQKGLLLAAANKLKDLGASVRSARVHTWGRQIEDLFHIEPPSLGEAEFLQRLREGLML